MMKLSKIQRQVKNHILGLAAVIALILLFEKNYLLDTLNDKWIGPIASRISDEPVSLIFLAVLLLSFVIWVFTTSKNGFLLIFFYFYTAFVAIVLRTGDWWIINNRIALVVIVVSLIAFMYFLWRWYHAKDKEDINPEVYDAFDRRKLSEKIVTNLLSKRDIGESFNFCLLGEWGSGKTHMFKMIKKEIKNREEYNQELFLFEFSPWHHSTSEDLERELIKQLAESDNPELRSIFDDLLHLFYGDNTNFLSKAIAYLLRKVLGDGKDVKARLNDFLRGKGKERHIIILFDDIDRLDRDEIRATLKIIRNILDYKNIHFGVGFDLDYLGRTLFRTDLKLKKNPHIYLDKFFQLKIRVPTAINLKKYFLDFFLKEFPDLIESTIYNRLSIDYDNVVSFKLIKTPRDIENIIYNAKLMHMGLMNSADLVVIILLEILKLKDPQSYNQGKTTLNNLTKFETIDNFMPDGIKPIVYYSQKTQYPISKFYYRNYFENSLGQSQIDSNRLEEILSIEDSHDSIKRLKIEIDNGYGGDIFNRFSWQFKDKVFDFSKKNIDVVVKCYEHYQGNHFVPFMDLIMGSFSNGKDSKSIQDMICKAASKEYYYKLYFILQSNEDNALSKVIDLLYEVVEIEGRSANRHLYFVLVGLYTQLKESPAFQSDESLKLVNSEIRRFIEDLAEDNPWYFIVNFIIDLHWRDLNRDDGPNEYTVFNGYVPDVVAVARMKRYLRNRMDSEIEMDEKMKIEILQFLDEYESKLSTNDGITFFKFSNPQLFRHKPGVNYEKTL